MDLSIVVPTYNEKENLQALIKELDKEFKDNKIKGEIIVVDDNSPDGTGKIADKLKGKYKFLQVIHRKGKLGLGSAVISGWRIAKSQILGVMDADFSHPTNKIHELYEIIKNNKADLAIGSRYVKGGKIIGWNFKRKLMSRVAVALFKPFSNVKDPMTGFFLIKKSCLNGKLSPRGFRLLVEILIKCKIKRIKEIPITFINRKEGKSKAGFNEILGYLYKLVESIPYKKNLFVEFFKFAFVGAIGTIVNLLVLYLLTEFVHVYYILSAIFAFVVAATHNFILNKLWTFKERLEDNFSKKYVQFFSVCLISLIVNLFFLYIFTEIFGIYYLISQVLAIGIALFINFTGNKIWTFAK